MIESQSLRTDQGSSDCQEALWLAMTENWVAIPPYRSGQFRHGDPTDNMWAEVASQSLRTDQGSSDRVRPPWPRGCPPCRNPSVQIRAVPTMRILSTSSVG